MDNEPRGLSEAATLATAVREPLADREARNPFFRYLLHLGLPVSLSLVVHFAVLIFAAQYGIRLLTRPSPEIGQWEGSVIEADELAGAFQWADEQPLETPDETPPENLLEQLSSLPEISSFDVGALDIGAAASTASGDAGSLGLGDGTLSLIGTGSGAAAPGTGGFGSGMGGGARVGRAGIWNLSIRANRVVYVVDFSGSIIVAVDDLKRELKRSIGRLKPVQSFNVIIFYSAGGGQDERVRTESFKPQLEPATTAIRREFFEWIDRKAPMGVTEPLQAMRRALSMKPEAIFFFSDGYFDDNIVTEIERANRMTNTRIYCLVFDEILLQDTSGLPRETEGARRLKRVAESNAGQVKIVTGKDLAR